MKIVLQAAGSGEVCREILAELPEWFGIDDANDDYVRMAETHETFVAREDDRAVGLLTLVTHSPYSAEIHLMAVRRSLRRSGIGRALVIEAESLLRTRGAEFLQVKTLSPSREDAGYDETRRFYEALGFRWLEEFPTLWDPDNPALQMIKYLAV